MGQTSRRQHFRKNPTSLFAGLLKEYLWKKTLILLGVGYKITGTLKEQVIKIAEIMYQGMGMFPRNRAKKNLKPGETSRIDFFTEDPSQIKDFYYVIF